MITDGEGRRGFKRIINSGLRLTNSELRLTHSELRRRTVNLEVTAICFLSFLYQVTQRPATAGALFKASMIALVQKLAAKVV